MSPGGVPGRLDVADRAQVLQRRLGRQAATSSATCHFAWATARSARWSARRAAARPHCCASSPGLDRDYDGTVQLPRHGRLGVMFQEPRLLPWRTVEQNVRLAAPDASDDGARRAVRHRSALPRIAITSRRAVARSGTPRGAGARLRGRARSPAARRAVRVAGRGAGGAARQELVDLVTRKPVTTLLVTHDVEEAIGLADRLFLLSASPCRVIADMPIESPRAARTPHERRRHSRQDRAQSAIKPAERHHRAGSCRAADRSRTSPAGRTAPSSRATTSVATGSNMP